MAETLLSFGVQKLWDLLVRESYRFKGVDEQLTELKSNLNLLRSFLKDADAKKHASETVRNFVEEIKEIVFDTEDIIETFLLNEELRKESGIKKRMRRLSCFIADRRKVASDMRGISKRISKVIHDMQSFGVQPMIIDGSEYSNPLQERQREMRKTFPSDKESDFVGLEQNMKKLIGYLVEEDNIQVVSIIGMGGIGKTTLARQVFNHEMVKNHFDGVAWVCVSQKFTRKDVWQTILQKLSSKYDEHRESNMTKDDLQKSNMTEDELQNQLFRRLETSKSLIVLDDMWKEEDWDIIKHVFPPTKGWKVLLTTRSEYVALRADPTCVILKPECLTLEESWTLFQRIVFPKKDTSESKIDVEMEAMGRQMTKQCGGLPLAVKVLGGLLAAQHTSSEWKRIYGNIKSHIVGGTSFNDRNMSSVYQILYLSFEELPIYLKNYFLYLAHFPEDYTIIVENLSYYWAAEGILRPRYYDEATIREVTDGYIEELVKRNMVISERDFTTSRFEIFYLHDMMRQVCLRKAEEENVVHIVDTRTLPANSRRIAVHRLDETYDLVRKMKNLKLRALLVFLLVKDRMTWDLSFKRLQLLRVLDLYGANFEGGKLPSSIGKMIHLRYLSLDMAEVTHLPSSMRNLKKMLYLNLYVVPGFPIYMTNFLEELRELKCLYLPLDIKGKTKLELGNLVNLEMLENLSLEHCNVEDLQQMTRLRTLDIRLNSKGCTTETISSSLSKLRHLKNLTIFGSTNDEEGFVLDCVHLKEVSELYLCKYMPRLHDEQHFPLHLTTLCLEYCRLEEDPMPMLEKMLQLKKVWLWTQSFDGKRMVCSDGGFPQLHKLSIVGLKEWEEWIVEEGCMPLLHTLTIRLCPKLKELPDGLRFLYSLKDMTMPKEWKERLSVGGADYYKVQHISSVNYQD